MAESISRLPTDAPPLWGPGETARAADAIRLASSAESSLDQRIKGSAQAVALLERALLAFEQLQGHARRALEQLDEWGCHRAYAREQEATCGDRGNMVPCGACEACQALHDMLAAMGAG